MTGRTPPAVEGAESGGCRYEEDRRVLRLRIADLKAQLVRAVPPAPTWSEFYDALEELPETWAEYIADPETKADVRADLESKVAGIVVFPANRNKWLSVDKRVQVVWREGVTS